MRILTPADVARELTECGFPTIFREIVLGEHKKYGGGFSHYFERPSEFYRLLAEQPEGFPFAETILPLHESNYELFWSYAPREGVFIQHSIEWSASMYKVVATSLPEYLEYEVHRLCDYGVGPEELRAFGMLLGYPEIERVVTEYEKSS